MTGTVREMADTWQERRRATSRRPITAAEVPHLEALGAGLWRLRRQAGMSRRALGEGAALREGTIEEIEHATRRTRRSTLARIAAALVEWTATPETAEEIEQYLVTLAGPALGGESIHPERVERRRQRREARKEKAAQESALVASMALDFAEVLAEELIAPKMDVERRRLEKEAETWRLTHLARLSEREDRLRDRAEELREREKAVAARERAVAVEAEAPIPARGDTPLRLVPAGEGATPMAGEPDIGVGARALPERPSKVSGTCVRGGCTAPATCGRFCPVHQYG